MCPQFPPIIAKDTKKGGPNKYYRFEKHTLRRYYYEDDEYLQETEDERKFENISYIEFLNRIYDGKIKPEELGIKL